MKPTLEFALLCENGLYFLWSVTHNAYLLNDKTLWHEPMLKTGNGHAALYAIYGSPISAFAFLEQNFTFFTLHIGKIPSEEPVRLSAYWTKPSTN